MKIYSYKQLAMDTWNHEERSEEYQPGDHLHLGTVDGREFFSYNPETVTLAENDEKFEVTVYSSNKKDVAFLTSIRDQLTVIRQEVHLAKQKIYDNNDLFDILVGLSANDANIVKMLADVKKDIDATYAKYGF